MTEKSRVLTLAGGYELWAFLALPHGFAALSATAWVVHVANQDAATLAGALTLSDSSPWNGVRPCAHCT